MTYKLNVLGSVEASLFEKFAETLVYWHHGNVSITEFRELLVSHVGGCITGKSISNWFNRGIKEVSIEGWRIDEFCRSFEESFEHLSLDQKNVFKDIKLAFDTWKNDLQKKNTIGTNMRDQYQMDLSFLNRELRNSAWYTYMLAEEFNSFHIQRGVIQFGSDPFGKNCLLYKMNPSFHDFQGTAEYTKSNCLSISFDEDNFDYRYLHLLISYKLEKVRPDILLGIITNVTHQLSSNFIVLEKKLKTEELKAGSFENGSSQIPRHILDLLFLDKVSQINLPTRAISQMEHIEKFLISYKAGETTFPKKYPTFLEPNTEY